MTEDPFVNALLAMQPDFDCTQVGPAFGYERAAACVSLPPRLFLAWARGEYQFRTFDRSEPIFRDGMMVSSRRMPQRKAYVKFLVSPWALAELKKRLAAEPRPFPPFTKAKSHRRFDRESPMTPR